MRAVHPIYKNNEEIRHRKKIKIIEILCLE
jgi:hypothetical protein